MRNESEHDLVKTFFFLGLFGTGICLFTSEYMKDHILELLSNISWRHNCLSQAMSSNPVQAWFFFSGFNLKRAFVVCATAMINHIFNHSPQFKYMNFYIFITCMSWYVCLIEFVVELKSFFFSILHLHARVCRVRSERSHTSEESPPGRAKKLGENTKSTGKRDGEEKYGDACYACWRVCRVHLNTRWPLD